MKAVAILPARMGSSRFYGKPMALIQGIPMIGHCYYRTKMCEELLDTYVATCDAEIFEYITSIGGKAIMTSVEHERATDRSAEAMLKIEDEIKEKVDVVVMVQGDEPLVTPTMISDALKPFYTDETVNVVNLMGKIDSVADFEDPNEVKVVANKDNNAIYFSREPIPSRRKGFTDVPMFKQVCIIPFRRDFLIEFNRTPETILEKIESVDMMRIVENGGIVRMVNTAEKNCSVDTESDLARAENMMKDDQLMREYSKNMF